MIQSTAKHYIYKTVLLLVSLHVCPANAQTDPADTGRITTSAYMIGVGPTRILDTYLSQEHFSGTGMTYLSAVERKQTGKQWSTAIQHQAHIAKTHDRSDTADELEGSYGFLGTIPFVVVARQPAATAGRRNGYSRSRIHIQHAQRKQSGTGQTLSEYNAVSGRNLSV